MTQHLSRNSHIIKALSRKYQLADDVEAALMFAASNNCGWLPLVVTRHMWRPSNRWNPRPTPALVSFACWPVFPQARQYYM